MLPRGSQAVIAQRIELPCRPAGVGGFETSHNGSRRAAYAETLLGSCKAIQSSVFSWKPAAETLWGTRESGC